MMRRTGFRRAQRSAAPAADREQRLAARAARAMAEVTPRASVVVACDELAPAVPKAAPVRSENYRRLVASLPCMACGVPGLSQCAHANTGKGMGLKVCDLESFPLCSDRPGTPGCHSLFDQGALLPKAARRAIEPAWIADTQRRIIALGLWPAGIQQPEEGAAHVR
ncbi:hypothetical protein [Paracidovorax avenae]|uniref:hypothetical protein n=1 Tax=Paracidovorax avenae TaxID=80867 RepID=UPI001CEF70A9|nr:hypothetical protein [Paracidovorax avenae]